MESQVGVVITLDTIYEVVKDVPELIGKVSTLTDNQVKQDDKIRKLSTQVAVQWVLLAPMALVIAATYTKGMGL